MSNPISNKSVYQAFFADFSSIASLRSGAKDDPDKALGDVARQFESLFLAQMLKAMRDSLPGDSLMSGPQMSTYTQLLDQQLALDLAKGRGIGLADLIERQLLGDDKARRVDRLTVASAYGSTASSMDELP